MSAPRAAWMRLLALAPVQLLERSCAALQPLPAHEPLNAPEVGLALVRGRVGGRGEPFNVGEMTVTRARVAVGETVGIGVVAGSAARHAELAALCDALLQLPRWERRVENAVLAPIRAELTGRRETVARERAATTADFVTLVRERDES